MQLVTFKLGQSLDDAMRSFSASLSQMSQANTFLRRNSLQLCIPQTPVCDDYRSSLHQGSNLITTEDKPVKTCRHGPNEDIQHLTIWNFPFVHVPLNFIHFVFPSLISGKLCKENIQGEATRQQKAVQKYSLGIAPRS
jgi:hypothetical protein